jgi:type II secretory ATPase GspE/PulE/Tfp pilus assembly ATPase PilB-like protein
LLDKTRMPPSLTQLGLENAMQMELERVIDRSVGALLVTGPTGSGKTTTLHGALADLARPEVTVITIEDPVEYELRGAYQLQVNPAAGVTYASALRAVLRGDPDVIMVGEIRDAETAQLALGAALAGHFVLSTLHTGDAPSTVTRLHEMGVERYVVTAGLAAVLGQRLVRRLCLYCRERYEPAADVVEHAGSTSPDATFFRAVGCPYCSGGYYGRIGVFELLVLNDGRPTAGLWSDALAKAEAGMTSLDELYRVVTR